MKQRTLLSASWRPFLKSPIGFTSVNYTLIFLLAPAATTGCMRYGMYCGRVIAASVFFCMAWDALFGRLSGEKGPLDDGSAPLCGALLGMLLPPPVPWWTIAFAAGAAMFLGKRLFGPAGASPFNAVCIGWAAAMISWPSFADPTYGSVGLGLPFDTAFPLAELRRSGVAAFDKFPAMGLLLGRQAGTAATVAAPAIVVAGAVAIALGFIPWIVPASFFVSLAFVGALFSNFTTESHVFSAAVFHTLGGFSIIGGFFLCTDVSSRPISRRIMILYGCFTGALTVFLRAWSDFAEPLPFAILIVNMVVPLLDRRAGSRPVHFPELERL